MLRWLLRLTLMLCLGTTLLAAQNVSNTDQKSSAKETQNTVASQLRVVAPQLAELDVATLKAAGLTGTFLWHYGKVTSLGNFSQAGGNEVVIAWDEGGASRMQGGITDPQWEIFKLAFCGTGRVAVLSDSPYDWRFDYRFLEARR